MQLRASICLELLFLKTSNTRIQQSIEKVYYYLKVSESTSRFGTFLPAQLIASAHCEGQEVRMVAFGNILISPSLLLKFQHKHIIPFQLLGGSSVVSTTSCCVTGKPALMFTIGIADKPWSLPVVWDESLSSLLDSHWKTTR